ncbi:MAG: 2-dehydropantoate 2-reductase [Puniceicoccales bacterium]|nr:2-dehydropantoate 2-reductase [Puniceicoccales bacterium]
MTSSRETPSVHPPLNFTRDDNRAALKIAILGTGAIGLFYGAGLARAGHDVRFIARSDAEVIRNEGITVSTLAGEWRVPPSQFKVFTDVREAGACDLVFVTLKAVANASMPALLPPLDSPDGHTVFVTLQNGMGNVEVLARLFGAGRATAGLCFTCNVRTAPGRVTNTQIGRIQFAESEGPATDRTRWLASLVESATGAKCAALDSLARALWFKLCWNIPFNGLAIAAGGVTTDIICASPPLREIAMDLLREVAAAAAADGVEIPGHHIQRQLDDLPKIGAYKPSSLVDYLAGRPVEVEAIWGEPLRRGLAHNVPMPRLSMLHSLLQHLCAHGQPVRAG